MGKRNKTKLSRIWTIWDDHDLGLKSLLDLDPPPPRPPVILPYLPAEVSRSIAKYLTDDSAHNLSVSCKALRDAGEMQLWDFVSFGVNEFEEHSEEHGFSAAHCFKNELSLNLAKAARFSEAMRGYPMRLESLTTLDIVVYAGESNKMESTLLDLIKLCAPRLKDLNLVCRPTDDCLRHSSGNPALSGKGFFNMLCALGSSFPKLSALGFQLPNEAHHYASVSNMLRSFPGVSELTVKLWGPRHPCSDCYTEFQGHDEFLPFDNILYLQIDGIYEKDQLGCFFARRLSIRLGGAWDVGDRSINPILGTLAARNLDCINLYNACWEESTYLNFRFPHHATGKTKRLILRGVNALAKERDLSLENTILWQLSNVIEELALLPTEPVERFKSFPDKVEHSLDLPSHQSLLRSANLKAVRLMTATENEFWALDVRNKLNDSSKWNESQTIGTLIRSYVHPKHGECLFHLRQLRWTDLDPGTESSGRAREWSSGIEYRNYSVEEDVWRKVYMVAGLKYPWKKGARRLTLPDAAWDVLEKWREGQRRRFRGI